MKVKINPYKSQISLYVSEQVREKLIKIANGKALTAYIRDVLTEHTSSIPDTVDSDGVRWGDPTPRKRKEEARRINNSTPASEPGQIHDKDFSDSIHPAALKPSENTKWMKNFTAE